MMHVFNNLFISFKEQIIYHLKKTFSSITQRLFNLSYLKFFLRLLVELKQTFLSKVMEKRQLIKEFKYFVNLK